MKKEENRFWTRQDYLDYNALVLNANCIAIKSSDIDQF